MFVLVFSCVFVCVLVCAGVFVNRALPSYFGGESKNAANDRAVAARVVVVLSLLSFFL